MDGVLRFKGGNLGIEGVDFGGCLRTFIRSTGGFAAKLAPPSDVIWALLPDCFVSILGLFKDFIGRVGLGDGDAGDLTSQLLKSLVARFRFFELAD